MALEVNAPSGPNFRQNGTPADATIGNLWFRPDGGNCAMSNGTTYGGVVERVGIAGYVAASVTNKLVFQTETVASITSVPSVGSGNRAGTCSMIAGYLMGGTSFSGIDKLTFSSEQFSTISSRMDENCEIGSGSSAESSSAGYAYSGYNGSSVRTKVVKLLFSNDSTATNTSNVTVGRHACGAAASGANSYVGGGAYASGSGLQNSSIDKHVFSTDAITLTGLTLASICQYPYAVQDKASAGYYLGRYNSGTSTLFSTISRIRFADEAISHFATTLLPILSGCASSYVAGYAQGGLDTAWNTLTSIGRLQFSNEAVSTLASGLTSPNARGGSFEHLNAPLGSA